MEVVLLWLDELDDLLFAGALLADRLRLLALGIGAAAAGGLALSMLEIWNDAWALEAAYTSALCVTLWLSSGLLGERGAATGFGSRKLVKSDDPRRCLRPASFTGLR
jgi:hypothetical protein